MTMIIGFASSQEVWTVKCPDALAGYPGRATEPEIVDLSPDFRDNLYRTGRMDSAGIEGMMPPFTPARRPVSESPGWPLVQRRRATLRPSAKPSAAAAASHARDAVCSMLSPGCRRIGNGSVARHL
jgi:hypothetical protein